MYKFIPRNLSKQIKRKLSTSLDDTSNLSLYVLKYGETTHDTEYIEISDDDKVEIFKNLKEIKGNLGRQDWLTSFYSLYIKNNENGKEVKFGVREGLYEIDKQYMIDDEFEKYSKAIGEIILKYGTSDSDFRRP